MARLEAGRIDKGILGIIGGQDAHDAMAGGLRLARNDADLGTDQTIQQGRFADVRFADNGNGAGFHKLKAL